METIKKNQSERDTLTEMSNLHATYSKEDEAKNQISGV